MKTPQTIMGVALVVLVVFAVHESKAACSSLRRF